MSEDDRDDDDLRPARGIAANVLVLIALWVLVALVAVALYGWGLA